MERERIKTHIYANDVKRWSSFSGIREREDAWVRAVQPIMPRVYQNDFLAGIHTRIRIELIDVCVSGHQPTDAIHRYLHPLGISDRDDTFTLAQHQVRPQPEERPGSVCLQCRQTVAGVLCAEVQPRFRSPAPKRRGDRRLKQPVHVKEEFRRLARSRAKPGRQQTQDPAGPTQCRSVMMHLPVQAQPSVEFQCVPPWRNLIKCGDHLQP